MLQALDRVLEELARRFEKIEQQYLPSKRFVKVKFRDFTQTTLEEGFGERGEPWLSVEDYRRLLLTARARKPLSVRLLGAGLRLEPRAGDDVDQLSLFD